MDQRPNPGKINVGPAPPGSGSPAPARRRAPQPRKVYQYYLEDHPILGPVVILLLGGLCVYSTLVTNILRDWVLGPHPLSSDVGRWNGGADWFAAFVVALMFIAFIFLLINSGELLVRRLRRRAAVCAKCGLVEQRGATFRHVMVEGTIWEEITCPGCGTAWYARV